MSVQLPFRWWQRICEVLGTILGAVMIVVVVYQVIARYTPVPLAPWTEEAARFLFIWTTALIAGPAYARVAYVGVDLVPLLVPDWLYPWWMRALHLGALVFAYFLITEGFDLGLRTMNQSTPGLGITMGYINASIGFAGVNLAVMVVGVALSPQKRSAYGQTPETAEAIEAAKKEDV